MNRLNKWILLLILNISITSIQFAQIDETNITALINHLDHSQVNPDLVNDYLISQTILSDKLNDYISYAEQLAMGIAGLALVFGTSYYLTMPSKKSLGKSNKELISNYKIGDQDMEIYGPGDIKIKFDDVAGLHAVKKQMQEIIFFINENVKKKEGKPTQESVKKNAKIPKGVLFSGGPGNGKTMLAKAIAGEAQCPFINLTAGSFTNKFQGESAQRVRNLFKTAQKLANKFGACIIFIDEIDGIAIKRTNDPQSLFNNQIVTELLTQMDGLKPTDAPIIIIGATNRPEALDDAFIRAGRFDIKIEIPKPNLQERAELITKAFNNLNIPQQFFTRSDINSIAQMTTGLSGAELANLINEAVILAEQKNKNFPDMVDIEEALDNIKFGRKIENNSNFNPKIKADNAIYQAGIAVGWKTLNGDTYKVKKVSIQQRTNTLGGVRAELLPGKSISTSEQDLNNIVIMLCGDAALDHFGKKGTADSNIFKKDIIQARELIKNYVATYMYAQANNDYISNEIMSKAHLAAKNIVADNAEEIERISKLLERKDTILEAEIYFAPSANEDLNFTEMPYELTAYNRKRFGQPTFGSQTNYAPYY